ncbi:MAG: hypothetical protein Aurels2KO_16940 [Aureliella sp.]
MTRSRRNRDAIAPSLFPFLAVLLCTMGSLVLILMLIVAGAQASTRRVTQAVEEELQFRTAAVELKEKSLEKDLDEATIEVEKKRLALQHVENHIQDTLDELAKLKKTKELLEEETASESVEEQQRKLSELERQLAEAKDKLDEVPATKPNGDKPIFAIIPYEGRNGTHRRPIYLECIDGKLIIQPEGVELTERDLQPPYGPGNPLDAALRTIRSEFAPANGAVTSTAYPLLIVRPSGILAYLRARRAMSGWDDQFGYELVDEELELAFPESKSGLKQQIAKTLDLARQRQAAIAMAMPRTYRGEASQYASNGFGGSSGPGGNAGGSGSYDSSRSLSAPGRGGFSADGFSKGFASGEPYAASGEAVEEILSGAAGFGGQPGGSAGRAGSPGVGAGTGLTMGQGTMSGEESLLGSNASGGPANGSPGDVNGQGDGNSTLGNESSRGSSLGAMAGSSGGGVDGGSAAGSSSMGSPGSGGASAGGAQTGGEQVGIPTFGLGANSSRQQGGTNQGNQVSQNGSSRRGSPGGNTANSSGSRRGQGGSSGSSSSSAGGQRGSASDTRPVASTRGRDWAWSGGSTTLTPVSRSIDMKCTLDGWVLPEAAGKKQIEIPYEGTPLQRAEKLAELIHNRVESWGFALEGGYWRPELMVEVAPGAKWRFDQLVRLFEGSGLRIRGKYAQPTGQTTLPRRGR